MPRRRGCWELQSVAPQNAAPRSRPARRTTFPSGPFSAKQGRMAAASAKGCGGVWRRVWRRGAGGPARRCRQAFASNARDGVGSAAKCGYDAATAGRFGSVEVALRCDVPPSACSRGVGTRLGLGSPGLGSNSSSLWGLGGDDPVTVAGPPVYVF